MPPDQGVASKQMSGKKGNKFQITVIGKKGPNKQGFYYHNNKTAWMTRGLLEK